MIKKLMLDTRLGNWLCAWIERLTGLAVCDAEFLNSTRIVAED